MSTERGALNEGCFAIALTLSGVLPSLVPAIAPLDIAIVSCVVRLHCLGGHFGSGRRRIIYTKLGWGTPMLGWRGDSGGTRTQGSSLRLQDHPVLALILVTHFPGKYIISTFLHLSFSSRKTGHLARPTLEILTHKDICGSERPPAEPLQD